MPREISLTDSVATALSDEKRDGETYSMAVKRLLEGTSGEPQSTVEGPEQLAQNAMNVTELQAAHSRGLTNVEYLAEEYDLDAEQYGTVDALRAAKEDNQ